MTQEPSLVPPPSSLQLLPVRIHWAFLGALPGRVLLSCERDSGAVYHRETESQAHFRRRT